MDTVDYVVMSLYFVCLNITAIVAFVAQYRQTADAAPSSFFLAGKDMHWAVVATSLYASNIGSEHFVGLAGSGASLGLSCAWGEWGSVYFILILAWVTGPIFIRGNHATVPSYFATRFSPRERKYLACVSLGLYVLSKMSVGIFTGSVLLRALFGIDGWGAILVIVTVCGVYTVCGGLRAVMYVEVFQTGVLILGGGLVLLYSHAAMASRGMTLAASLPDSMLHMVRPPSDAAFPATGVLLGMPFVSFWYWCVDQVMVQRVLATRHREHCVPHACNLAALFKMTTVFLMVFPGLMARVLYPADVLKDPQVAYIVLVQRVLPHGVRGVVVAAMMGALMSSLSSVFHSAASLIAFDILGTGSVLHGRIFTMILTFVACLWVPLLHSVSPLIYIYSHKVMSYFAPPIAVVFIASCTTRLSSNGALAAMIVGNSFGVLRLVLESTFQIFKVEPAPVVREFVQSAFLHFAVFLAMATCVVVLISLALTHPPSASQDAENREMDVPQQDAETAASALAPTHEGDTEQVTLPRAERMERSQCLHLREYGSVSVAMMVTFLCVYYR